MKKILIMLFSFVLLIGCVSTLYGQDRGIQLEQVENKKPSFYVRASVDRADQVYQEDDLVEVTVTSSRAGYLYLVHQDAAKKVVLLYPNKYHSDNKIERDKKIVVPDANSGFRMRVSAPFGEEKLLAVVTLKPLRSVRKDLLGENYTEVTTLTWEDFTKAIIVEETGSSSTKPELSQGEWAEHLLKITTIKKSESRGTQKEKRFLVAFGIGSYQDKSIPPLKVCPNDAQMVINTFRERCNVPSSNALILTDEKATLERIKVVFCEALPKLTKPGDIIFIYWSGHGGRCSDKNGDEKDGKDEFLVPYDGLRSNPDTMLIDDVFGRWIQNLDGRKILFILDACNSAGNATRSKSIGGSDNLATFFDESADNTTTVFEPLDFGVSELSFIKDIGQNDVAVIASSAPNEASLVRQENDMSVMTYYLLDVLRKESGLSHTKVFEKIKNDVNTYVKENFNLSQTMVIQDDFAEPLILNP